MATAALTKTFGSASSASDRYKFTFSTWFKRGTAGDNDYLFGHQSSDGANDFAIRLDKDSGNSLLRVYDYQSSSYTIHKQTSRFFRDHSAWYHLVVKIDTTQSSASDRVKIYINGVEETSFSTSVDPNQNQSVYAFSNTGQPTVISGRYTNSLASGYYFDGSLTHTHCCIGYAYDASSFGETDTTSGIWKPKTAPSVTYGSNGFFLKFENSGAMGTDSSGNSNTFTINGTLTQNIDTPSNNFATLNGINAGGGNTTLSNGGLTYTRTDYSHNARSTLGFTKGKWYWEQKQSDNSTRIGLITSGFSNNLDTDSTDAYYGTYANGGVYILLSHSGTSWQSTNNDTSRSITTYTNAIGCSAGDILMGAVDADAGKLWIGVNGVWMNSGDPAAGSNNQITFTNSTPDELQVYAGFGTSSSRTVNFNFGSGFFGTTAVTSANADANGLGAFEYTVPSGYYAICTKNIKEFG